MTDRRGQSTEQSSEPRAWHALEAEATLVALASQAQGLSVEAAAERLAQYGPNRLTPPKPRPAWLRFLVQFHDVLIYVLLAAAVLTSLLGHWVDTGVIVGVVVINALIGFIQEGKAEKALEAIRGLLSPVSVRRVDGDRDRVRILGRSI